VTTSDINPPLTLANDYHAFLEAKTQIGGMDGFDPIYTPNFMFDFQRALVEWAIRKGRAAIWADCGLGKSPMAMVWAENVIRKMGGAVLIITPLAVAEQFVREGEKFGIEVTHSRDGKHRGGIVVTNYERLHYFDPSQFVGAVGDEAQAIKAFDGKRRKQVVRFFSKLRLRLLTTATPAPNDYIELGTASECLGIMTQSDMLGYFFRETKDMRHTVFKEGDFWNHCKYTFKPHSEIPFWKWIVSWARGIQRPSDLGFDDSKFILPPLNYRTHVVNVPWTPPGELFPRPAVTLIEQRDERKRTVSERCERVRELVSHGRPAISWCHYNEEGDYLAKCISDSVQISGRDSLDDKEAKLLDFARGNIRVLVTKGKIGCWGLNLQHCGDMTFFPTFSFEQVYQGIRRCWRFGRKGPVNVEVVSAPGESKVMEGLERKQQKATEMFAALVRHMNEAISLDSIDRHHKPIQTPAFLNTMEEIPCLSSTNA
jgi:hypothetical protein